MATRHENGRYTGHTGPGDGSGMQKVRTYERPEECLGEAEDDPPSHSSHTQPYPVMRKERP